MALRNNPVICDQLVVVQKKAVKYKLIEQKQRIQIKGQGTFEIKVKNLVNLITMKSLMNNPAAKNETKRKHSSQIQQV